MRRIDIVNQKRRQITDYLLAHDINKDSTIESTVNGATQNKLDKALLAMDLAASNGIILNLLKR